MTNRELPERFPPLATRVKSWDTQRLLAETKRYDDMRVHAENKVVLREDVILRELLERDDVPFDGFLDVLNRGVATPHGMAGPQLAAGVRLAVELGRVAGFAEGIRAYVASLDPRGERLGLALRVLQGVRELDLQADAARALRAYERPTDPQTRMFAEEALNYLRLRGDTADSLAAIVAANGGENLGKLRAEALQGVRSRLK